MILSEPVAKLPHDTGNSQSVWMLRLVEKREFRSLVKLMLLKLAHDVVLRVRAYPPALLLGALL